MALKFDFHQTQVYPVYTQVYVLGSELPVTTCHLFNDLGLLCLCQYWNSSSPDEIYCLNPLPDMPYTIIPIAQLFHFKILFLHGSAQTVEIEKKLVILFIWPNHHSRSVTLSDAPPHHLANPHHQYIIFSATIVTVFSLKNILDPLLLGLENPSYMGQKNYTFSQSKTFPVMVVHCCQKFTIFKDNSVTPSKLNNRCRYIQITFDQD